MTGGEHANPVDYTRKDIPDELRRRLDQTRLNIDETIDEFMRRISPDNWMEQAMNKFQENAQNAVEHTTGFIKDHPISLALIGAGVGWLVADLIRSRPDKSDDRQRPTSMSIHDRVDRRNAAGIPGQELGHRNEERTRRFGHEAKERTKQFGHDAKERVQELGEEAKERAQEFGQQVKEHAHDVGHRAQEYWDQGRETVENAFEQHPLLFVAGAIGVGVALGTAIPTTKQEDRYLGKYRDMLFDRLSDYSHEAVHRAGEVAHSSFQAARDEAREQVDEMKDDSSDEDQQHPAGAVGAAPPANK